jgi:hypothetical protein
MHLLYFVEDAAQETFMRALVARAASQFGCDTAGWQHDVRISGGKGRTLRDMQVFLRDIVSGEVLSPDLLVLTVDGDCEANATRRRVDDMVQRSGYGGPVLLAIPDPHIERWYMSDPEALRTVSGSTVQPALPPIRCRKDLFKNALRQVFVVAGINPPLGGTEYGDEIVEQIDVYRARANDGSLDRFFNDAQAVFSALC